MAKFVSGKASRRGFSGARGELGCVGYGTDARIAAPVRTGLKAPRERLMLRLERESDDLQGEGPRFYFFSREEPRLHVHVQGQRGEAKFWLEPSVELAQNFG